MRDGPHSTSARWVRSELRGPRLDSGSVSAVPAQKCGGTHGQQPKNGRFGNWLKGEPGWISQRGGKSALPNTWCELKDVAGAVLRRKQIACAVERQAIAVIDPQPSGKEAFDSAGVNLLMLPLPLLASYRLPALSNASPKG